MSQSEILNCDRVGYPTVKNLKDRAPDRLGDVNYIPSNLVFIFLVYLFLVVVFFCFGQSLNSESEAEEKFLVKEFFLFSLLL